jgi:serine/threonine-protein kinase
MRVTAHLTEVATGYTSWSKSFDFPVNNVFGVQEEIAKSVADTLRPGFTKNGADPFSKWHSKDIASHNLFLLARFHLNRRRGKDIRRSISIFEGLLDKEPANARALCGLAECQFMLGMACTAPPSAAMTEAARLAREALAIDGRLPEAHATLGSVKALYEWDWKGADVEFRSAFDLSPNHASARGSYAFCYLLPMERGQDAVEQLREAVRLDPLSLPVNYMLGHVLYAVRQYDAAIKQCAVTIDLDPTYARAHTLMAAALAFTGSDREAARQADQAVKLTDPDYFIANWATAVAAFALSGQQRRATSLLHAIVVRNERGVTSQYWLALAYASVGKLAEAFALLNSAIHAREPWLASLVYEPLADPLRSDKRFPALLRSLGLPHRKR